MTKATFPLIDAADGRFVHIRSMAGRVVLPSMGPYGASKHAVSGLNWALRAELAQIGRMTSSVIEPGEIKTEIWTKAAEQIADGARRLESKGLTGHYQWVCDMFTGFIAEAEEKAWNPTRSPKPSSMPLRRSGPKAVNARFERLSFRHGLVLKTDQRWRERHCPDR